MVLPIHNEALNIPELSERLTKTLDEMVSGDWEAIMVDDGSTDESWELMKKLRARDSRFKLLRLSRNFGQYAAAMAGMSTSIGDCVIIMDADTQEPPEEIPKLYEKFRDGYDIVYGIRETRADNPARRLFTWIYWSILAGLSGVKMPRNQGMFRLASRRAAETISRLGDTARFIDGAFAWVGFPHTEVKIAQAKRPRGKSSYTPRKMLRVVMNVLTTYSSAPLRLASVLGVLFVIPAVGLAIYYIALRIIYPDVPPGFTATVILILLIGGLQMLLLGIIGEYIATIFSEVKGRPHYIVMEAQIGQEKDR
ncbi:MAG: glycosyltransferase family 2 protein [candidate division WOR-3 bacterium]